MSTPRAGQPVRGSTTGRPLMAAMDLLGRRWALRVLWELRDGPLGARALVACCEGISSSVLYDRLRELCEAGLVRQNAVGAYELTRTGAGLRTALAPLELWSTKWAAKVRAASDHGALDAKARERR